MLNIQNVANTEHVECRQPNAVKLGNLYNMESCIIQKSVQYGNLYNPEICTKWKCV